jgi:hypothetical protein
MPNLAKIYYDFKYSTNYRVLSFKIPNNVVIKTELLDKTFTIEEVIHSISELSDSYIIHKNNLIMSNSNGDPIGYISFSDVTLN